MLAATAFISSRKPTLEGCTHIMAQDNKSYCVLDFVVYRGISGEVVKEMAVTGMSDQRRQHWVFDAPYPQSTLKPEFIAENDKRKEHIKYDWNDGYVPYFRLPDILKSATQQYANVFVVKDSYGRMVADVIKRPVGCFKTLYAWLKYGVSIGDVDLRYCRYDYASPCMMHEKSEQQYCAKSRCTLLATLLRHHYKAVEAGKAGVEMILPTKPDTDLSMEMDCTKRKSNSSSSSSGSGASHINRGMDVVDCSVDG